MNEEDYLELENEPTEESIAEISTLRAELEECCKASNIPFQEHEDFDESSYITIELPSGRQKRTVYVFDLDDLKRLLSVPFERYRFLGNYVAICSYEDGIIEVAVRTLGGPNASVFYRRLLGRPIREMEVDPEDLIVTMEHPSVLKDTRVTLGPRSEPLATLSGVRVRPQRAPALKIDGLQISQHDEALDLLDKIANSVFFQIDMSLNFPLGS